ncbi:MAG: DUF302 domain-containing protein [Gammaproteobacteria bacterium]
MRLVAHINGQANAAKIGRDVPPDQILEVFRPDFAVRVWEACKPAGMDIPLRIHIYEDSAGNVIVAYRTAVETFAAYENPALTAIGKELDAIFVNILSVVTLTTAEAAHD